MCQCRCACHCRCLVVILRFCVGWNVGAPARTSASQASSLYALQEQNLWMISLQRTLLIHPFHGQFSVHTWLSCRTGQLIGKTLQAILIPRFTHIIFFTGKLFTHARVTSTLQTSHYRVFKRKLGMVSWFKGLDLLSVYLGFSIFLLGVGRLIAEAQVTPIVVPFWHEGKLLLLPSMVK